MWVRLCTFGYVLLKSFTIQKHACLGACRVSLERKKKNPLRTGSLCKCNDAICKLDPVINNVHVVMGMGHVYGNVLVEWEWL